MNELLAEIFTLDPTFNILRKQVEIYTKAEDQAMAWEYTLRIFVKILWTSKKFHTDLMHQLGNGTKKLLENNDQLWMTFINEYKIRGGRLPQVQIQDLFISCIVLSYIRELELLREQVFHPLEIIRSANFKWSRKL